MELRTSGSYCVADLSTRTIGQRFQYIAETHELMQVQIRFTD